MAGAYEGPAQTPGFCILDAAQPYRLSAAHGHPDCGRNNNMARKPTPRREFVLFNVYYEDGSQRSNRRVPADMLGGIDGDEPARNLIAEQDREISEKSGIPPNTINRIVRAANDVEQGERANPRAR